MLHAPGRSRRWTLVAVLLVFVLGLVVPVGVEAQGRPTSSRAAAAEPYFPDRFEWQKRKPEDLGMDSAMLDEAAKFASANENPNMKNLPVDVALSFSREPHSSLIGPTKERGALSGIVVRNGYIVAEWGDTERVDMTFSVTKSFLSTVVGLAWMKGLIRDVNDPVGPYMPQSGLFDTPHNAKITWDHLLRQTSAWEGALWGKPDWADRPEGEEPWDYPNRPVHEPGTHYKYNDVRVNVLALAALYVIREPLPSVLRREIMEPIGASSTWRWHGYDNSWIELDGNKVQASTGGGHWGGGMFISGRDMARFGYLFLRNGKWKDKQLVSEKWIEMARTPGTANPAYGYMNWFLNTERKPLPSAPASSVTFRGSGSNIIYMDWENDLVVVVRWIGGGNALDTFLGKVLASIRPAAQTQNQ